MRYLVTGLIAAMVMLMVAVNVAPAQAAESISDLEKAYRAYLQAVLDKDWDRITDGSSMESRKELETVPQDQRGMVMDMLQGMSTELTNSKLDSGEVKGEEGILLLHVPKEQGTLKGQVIMRKEGGSWRVHSQDWKETD